MDSVHRPPATPAPAPLTDDELRAAIRSFIAELAREAGRRYDIDVEALLERVRANALR